MILCVCKAVSDRQLQKEWMLGRVRSLEDVMLRTGAGTDCGTCRRAIPLQLARCSGADRGPPPQAEGQTGHPARPGGAQTGSRPLRNDRHLVQRNSCYSYPKPVVWVLETFAMFIQHTDGQRRRESKTVGRK